MEVKVILPTRARFRLLGGIFGIIILMSGVAFSGLLFPFRPQPSPQIEVAVQAAHDLDQYLVNEESHVAHLKNDLAKGIVWAFPDKRRTPVSIIYLHGFSASRGESAPLFNEIGQALGGNVFYTRFTAHGLNDNGESFSTLTAQNFIDDAREALALGRRIGERVVIVGMSTGAPAALALISENNLNNAAKDIAALILISPNYRPADPRTRILSGPLGPWITRLLVGERRGFKPVNEAHAYLWTPEYRSEGIAGMMDLVNFGSRMDLAPVQVPTLTLYTNKDDVVDLSLIRSRHEEIGAPFKRIVDLPGATNHVLASGAVTPESVPEAKKQILSFLKEALTPPSQGEETK